jgi:hypothetical protein
VVSSPGFEALLFAALGDPGGACRVGRRLEARSGVEDAEGRCFFCPFFFGSGGGKERGNEEKLGREIDNVEGGEKIKLKKRHRVHLFSVLFLAPRSLFHVPHSFSPKYSHEAAELTEPGAVGGDAGGALGLVVGELLLVRHLFFSFDAGAEQSETEEKMKKRRP